MQPVPEIFVEPPRETEEDETLAELRRRLFVVVAESAAANAELTLAMQFEAESAVAIGWLSSQADSTAAAAELQKYVECRDLLRRTYHR